MRLAYLALLVGTSGCGRVAFDPLTGEPALVGAWRFDEGVGDRAYDDSGNGNEMMLRGPAWAPRGESLQHLGDFAFSTGSPEGLAWDGSSLWLTARNPDTFYKLDTSVGLATGTCGTNGCIVGSFSSPGGFPEGMTWDGTAFWHCDAVTEQAYRIDPAAGLSAGTCSSANGCVLHSFSLPATGLYAESLAWDGSRLWLAHSGTDRLYSLDISVPTNMGTCTVSNGCVTGSFTTPSGYPEGIEWSGGQLFHTDAEAVTLYVLDVNAGLAADACTTGNGCILGEYPLLGTFSEDIAWEGATRLWTLDLGVKRVYQYGFAPAASCKVGGCIELDRHKQHDVVVSRSMSLDEMAEGFTIEILARPREVRDQSLFQYGWDPADREGIALHLRGDGTIQFKLGTGITMETMTGSAYRSDEWMHIAVSWDGAMMTCYINGEQACTPVPVPGPIQLDAEAGTLGSDAGGGGFFVGTIDELRVFAPALGPDAIRADAESYGF